MDRGHHLIANFLGQPNVDCDFSTRQTKTGEDAARVSAYLLLTNLHTKKC
jgi:hypothetical protein